MAAERRKIKANTIVKDLRSGMGDWELMDKYAITEGQLHKILGRLVDAGLINEMELYMRTSLTDTTVTRAFVDTQLAIQELYSEAQDEPPQEIDPKAEVEFTEVIDMQDEGFRKMIDKYAKLVT